MIRSQGVIKQYLYSGLNQFKEMAENINKKNSTLLFPVTISTF